MTDRPDSAPQRGRRWLAIIYGITAIPVGAWALALAYGLAKQRYEGTTREAQIHTIVMGALPVVLWIVFVVVSWVLSRKPSLRLAWRLWAVITAISLLLFSTYVVVMLIALIASVLPGEPTPNIPMPHPTDRP